MFDTISSTFQYIPYVGYLHEWPYTTYVACVCELCKYCSQELLEHSGWAGHTCRSTWYIWYVSLIWYSVYVTAHHVLHLTAPAYSCPELESLLPEDCPTLIPLPYAQLAQQEVASGTRPQASAYPAPMGSNSEDTLMQVNWWKCKIKQSNPRKLK